MRAVLHVECHKRLRGSVAGKARRTAVVADIAAFVVVVFNFGHARGGEADAPLRVVGVFGGEGVEFVAVGVESEICLLNRVEERPASLAAAQEEGAGRAVFVHGGRDGAVVVKFYFCVRAHIGVRFCQSAALGRAHNEVVAAGNELRGGGDGNEIVFAINAGVVAHFIRRAHGAALLIAELGVGGNGGFFVDRELYGGIGAKFLAAVEGIIYICAFGGAGYGHFRAFSHVAACGREYGVVGRDGLLAAAACLKVVGIEGRGVLVAPHVLLESREVDKRISVVLNAINRVVAVYFLLAHGVLLRPAQEHLQGPRGVSGVFVVAQHGTAPRGNFVFVGCRHIEINACEVAFVFVVRFEHGARIPAHGARSEFAPPLVGGIGGAFGFAVGIVAAAAVHVTVGRHKVHEVGVHGFGIVEPAFGERVLAVVLVALFAVIAGLVGAEGEIGGGGIHVPHFAVLAHIGGAEVGPKVVVAACRVVGHNIKQCRFQGIARFSFCRAVIARGCLRLRKERNGGDT